MLDTKTIGFMHSLCMGEIEEDVILPYPRMDPGEKETLAAVIRSVDSLLGRREREFREWDQRSELPASFLEKLKQSSLKERGAEAAANEIEILQVFAGQVKHRVERNFGKIDDNDDELVKSLADHAFAVEAFGWDTL